jgi:hypothetical protein
MRRLLWIGVGVAAAYSASRWWRRQRARFGADGLGDKARQGVRDLVELARLSVEEGRRAAAEKEAELRDAYDHPAEDRAHTPR